MRVGTAPYALHVSEQIDDIGIESPGFGRR